MKKPKKPKMPKKIAVKILPNDEDWQFVFVRSGNRLVMAVF